MKQKITSPLINDAQTFKAARNRFGHAIQTYDDGCGPLFICRNSTGIVGIVRAETWESALSICEDEFFPSGDEDAIEELNRIQAMPDGEEKSHAQGCWDEAYGFRPNGRKELDSTSHIFAKDLNGDRLDLLTPELLEQLELSLEIETPIEAQLEMCLPDWAKLVARLIPQIDDDYRATDDPDDDTPGMCLTIGFTPETPEKDYSWSYQTGNNSFTGGAYGHAYWAVAYLYRDSKPDEVANEIADQLGDVINQ